MLSEGQPLPHGIDREPQKRLILDPRAVLLEAFIYFGRSRLALADLVEVGVTAQLRARLEWAALDEEAFLDGETELPEEEYRQLADRTKRVLARMVDEGLLRCSRGERGIAWFECKVRDE